ncbi:MAG: radical SAM protein [Deltaproteobacteria bacterium]|nr:radical SAM protein [Deltaproteobacteria bacterium]
MNALAVTDRFALHVGVACTHRCGFCYTRDAVAAPPRAEPPLARLLGRIDLAARLGKRAMDLTGGEPTLRADLPFLVERGRRNGFRAVTVITNGTRTADPAYAKTLRAAGLTDGLFSLHGASPDVHDGLTGRPGSHGRLVASLDVFASLGIGTRVNTVVTGANLTDLDGIIRLVAPFRPTALNLLLLNPAASAARLPQDSPLVLPELATLRAALERLLDTHADAPFPINIRFAPLCLLPRHLEAVRTLWQKAHEDDEWDPLLHSTFTKGFVATAGAVFLGLFLRGQSPRFRSRDLGTRLARCFTAARARITYRQGRLCRLCSARRICPGLARAASGRLSEVVPLRLGYELFDPLAFAAARREAYSSLREP